MDTSETYIKMCEKAEEIQKSWQPSGGDWFVTSTSSLSYSYGGMRRGKESWHQEDAPKEFDWSNYEIALLTEQTVDSGYYGWGLGESFPDADEKELLENYFIWLPRQDHLQEMVKRADYSAKLHDGNLLLVSIFKDWVKENWQSLLSSENSMEQLWLAFVEKENYNKVWDGDDWIKE